MTEEQAIEHIQGAIVTIRKAMPTAKCEELLFAIDSLNKIKALKELLDKPVANIYFRQKVEDILKED